MLKKMFKKIIDKWHISSLNYLLEFFFLENYIMIFQKKNFFVIYHLLYKYLKDFCLIELNYFSMNINKTYIYQCFTYLKYSSFFLFKNLIDLIIIDNLNFNQENRFKISYNLYSFNFNLRIFVNIFVNELSSNLSLISLYPNLNWLEREAWDMFGIFFINHIDLRRILTDYGFKWYPLRKDFPVSGYIEAWFDENFQDILFKPIKLSQEMRFTNFSTVWEDVI